MYLKRHHIRGGIRFILCESYEDGGIWRHRELVDLGRDPGDWIEYPGGNAFYIRESLEDELREKGAAFGDQDLEAVFRPFLNPRIRRIVEDFEHRGPSTRPWKRHSREELFRRQRALHEFDKRRIHYLRCGRVQIGDLEGRPWPFLNVLIDKSRDEIEHLLEEMERELPPWERRPYLYTALRLQTRFSHLITRHHPEALDPLKVDEAFVEDLCRLNRDDRFFSGVDGHDPDTLHAYLVRYLILYFDSEFERGAPAWEYVQDFVRKHRFTFSTTRTSGFSEAEKRACRRLGIDPKAFHGMDRRELTRVYRVRVKESHPDRGGETEAFLKIQEAYEKLLRRKS